MTNADDFRAHVAALTDRWINGEISDLEYLAAISAAMLRLTQ